MLIICKIYLQEKGFLIFKYKYMYFLYNFNLIIALNMLFFQQIAHLRLHQKLIDY